MVVFGECGFAAEIPAFAGMEGGGAIARIFREAEHCNGRLRRMRLRRRDSRLRGNGRRGAISENIPRSGTLQWSPSANAASPQRFRLSPEWKYFFTLRRLRGGVKIRASEFLGGGEVPTIVGNTPPPATASRSHPPPQAAEGKNSFFAKKRIPIPPPVFHSREGGNLPVSEAGRATPGLHRLLLMRCERCSHTG